MEWRNEANGQSYPPFLGVSLLITLLKLCISKLKALANGGMRRV